MSGLVAYGSSDEEDQEEVQVVTSDRIPKEAQSNGVKANEAVDGHAPNNPQPTLNNQAPLMGPVVPTTHGIEYEDYDEGNDLMDMSERDAIRFLTQPSHPMTQLPSSPPGSPNQNVSTKFRRFLELKTKATHFNEDLANKNAFRNPNLLRAMMDRVGIDEQSQHKTSLPSTVFDATALPSIGYKEALLSNQQAIRTRLEADRRAQSSAGTRSIDFQAQGYLQQ